MTGLRWVRLDATFPTNPKILRLTQHNRHRAALVYVCSLAYSGQQGTDGHIPAWALNTCLHGRPIDAQHLVDAGLWKPNGDGWRIHDWHEYQPRVGGPTDPSVRGRRAAEARWGRTRQDPQ